uniref:NADH dehydrogenase subunit 4L n=1 Tax=Leptomastidea bifasciata TaxID=1880993 RepID=UPI002E797FB7|nr:NADH dehydrogenase subunit 4L [Leptomastidea bifasciata]WPT46962.1 NADH dehydrogenase subunit 4L [Leptomastidea bifasciata]
MFMNYYIYFFMFIFSLYLYSFFFNNVMLMLMSLEFMMLSLMLMLMNLFLLINCEKLILLYLIFVVCESVLGLIMLINLIRFNGNDNMKFMNLILW